MRDFLILGVGLVMGAAVLWAMGWLVAVARVRSDDPARESAADALGVPPDWIEEIGPGRWRLRQWRDWCEVPQELRPFVQFDDQAVAYILVKGP